mmetsp:Transcript_68187/g.184193  ORF Transcript_68187/g.184193 Transcript_68187/m.184193 type:complete len:239 (+) Transcript_68187:538-1254(+)
MPPAIPEPPLHQASSRKMGTARRRSPARSVQKPIVGKPLENASTSDFNSNSLPGGDSRSTFLKSTSLGPLCFCTSAAMSTASAMNSPTFTKSASMSPRDVIAGVPTRRPLGFIALLSPGIVFLFSTIEDASHTVSDFDPLTPLDLRSMRSKWLSVPPDTMSNALPWSDSPSAFAFFITCSWYWRNSGDMPCFRATASAVMDWLWGPPCNPGKTAALIFSSKSYMIGLPFLSTPFWPLL